LVPPAMRSRVVGGAIRRRFEGIVQVAYDEGFRVKPPARDLAGLGARQMKMIPITRRSFANC
jgi:hypothetical protein